MDPKSRIAGKRVLVVDDEQDVLDTVYAMLDACKIDTALTFEEGKRLLEEGVYDVAILDIMGVRGFELLEIANRRGVPALMLTAHGLSEENLRRSAEEGASYYAPKEKMNELPAFIADVLEARDKRRSPWVRWFERLSAFYDRRFGGTDWRDKEKRFWEERTKALH